MNLLGIPLSVLTMFSVITLLFSALWGIVEFDDSGASRALFVAYILIILFVFGSPLPPMNHYT